MFDNNFKLLNQYPMISYEPFLILSIAIPIIISSYVSIIPGSWPRVIFWTIISILISYVCYNASNYLYWEYRMSLLNSQSTDAERMSATADGGKNAFAIIFGWMYALIVAVLMASLINAIRWLKNTLLTRH